MDELMIKLMHAVNAVCIEQRRYSLSHVSTKLDDGVSRLEIRLMNDPGEFDRPPVTVTLAVASA